jgi:hypothetical protein
MVLDKNLKDWYAKMSVFDVQNFCKNYGYCVEFLSGGEFYLRKEFDA